MRKVASYTLGCKVNQYDTEAVLEKFKEAGYEITEFSEYADVYIVNTCTVTHLSDRKCRQMLRKTKKINPDSTLVAMGCYAQIAADKIKEHRKKLKISQEVLAQKSGVSLGSIKRFETKYEISLQSFIKIAIALDLDNDLENLFTQKTYTSIDEIIKG